jgi:hypothetical protein
MKTAEKKQFTKGQKRVIIRALRFYIAHLEEENTRLESVYNKVLSETAEAEGH